MKNVLTFGCVVVWSLSIAALSADAQQIRHTSETIDQIHKNLSDKQALLLDVREDRETKEGFVDGAVLVPLSILQEGKQTEGFDKLLAQRLPQKSIIYCYCAAGGRALTAAEILKKMGYDARALKPGFRDLVQAGFPTAKPKAAE